MPTKQLFKEISSGDLNIPFSVHVNVTGVRIDKVSQQQSIDPLNGNNPPLTVRYITHLSTDTPKLLEKFVGLELPTIVITDEAGAKTTISKARIEYSAEDGVKILSTHSTL